jgi:hypothetical protein
MTRFCALQGSNPATPTNEIKDLSDRFDRLAYQTALGARNGARLAKKYHQNEKAPPEQADGAN